MTVIFMTNSTIDCIVCNSKVIIKNDSISQEPKQSINFHSDRSVHCDSCGVELNVNFHRSDPVLQLAEDDIYWSE